jgi:CBS domain-containing protein
MTQPATTCAPETSIAVAGHLMEDHRCGALPVVDIRRRLIGVVTDRDLLLAAVNTNRNATNLSVYEAMKTDVVTCSPDDELATALEAMRTAAIRRLPVIDAQRHVIGLLSIDDVVRWGVARDGVSPAQVIEAFDGICTRRAGDQQIDAMG